MYINPFDILNCMFFWMLIFKEFRGFDSFETFFDMKTSFYREKSKRTNRIKIIKLRIKIKSE